VVLSDQSSIILINTKPRTFNDNNQTVRSIEIFGKIGQYLWKINSCQQRMVFIIA